MCNPGPVVPRFREVGDVTLDRLHSDGRVEDRWLALTPAEFALLWRLAAGEDGGATEHRWWRPASEVALLCAPQALAPLVARLRTKLEPFGLAQLIVGDHEAGYGLNLWPDDGRGGSGHGPEDRSILCQNLTIEEPRPRCPPRSPPPPMTASP